MRYFIRTPRPSAGKLLGPFDPIETLRRARTLRETGVDFCITDEAGTVLLSEDQIRRSEN